MAQKENEEKEQQRLEEIKRSEAWEKEQDLMTKILELQTNAGITCLGRDR